MRKFVHFRGRRWNNIFLLNINNPPTRYENSEEHAAKNFLLPPSNLSCLYISLYEIILQHNAAYTLSIS